MEEAKISNVKTTDELMKLPEQEVYGLLCLSVGLYLLDSSGTAHSQVMFNDPLL